MDYTLGPEARSPVASGNRRWAERRSARRALLHPTSRVAAPPLIAIMCLRKAYTLTPARLAANRRNAQQSTAPRTARGKVQSQMNRLRTGNRSRLYHNLLAALLNAPPCAVDRTAQWVLTPEQAAHPLIAEPVKVARRAEIEVVLQTRQLNAVHEDSAAKPSARVPPESLNARKEKQIRAEA